MPQVVQPLREIWDRRLRNAVFHADYTLHGGEVRLMGLPVKRFSHEDINTLVNRALVHHESLAMLYRTHTESYTEPTEIWTDAEFGQGEPERGIVVVRTDHGATGLQAVESAGIRWRVGRFLPGEDRVLDENPRQVLPPWESYRPPTETRS